MWLAILKLFLEYDANPPIHLKQSKIIGRQRDGSNVSAIDIITHFAKTSLDKAVEVKALLTKGRIWRHRLSFSKLNASKTRLKLDWTQYPERAWWKDYPKQPSVLITVSNEPVAWKQNVQVLCSDIIKIRDLLLSISFTTSQQAS